MPDVVTFDPTTRRIIPIDPGGGVDISLDAAEIYSEWKVWAKETDDFKNSPAFRDTGGDPTKPGQYKAGSFFLLNGWRIRPNERDHRLTIVGDLYTDPAGFSPIVPTLGGYTVAVEYETSSTATLIEGGGGADESLGFMDGAVWCSEAGSAIGTGYFDDPVDTIDAAVTIAGNENLFRVRLTGPLVAGFTFTSGATGIAFVGDGHFLNLNGQVFDGYCSLTKCQVVGTLGDGSKIAGFYDCSLQSLTGGAGVNTLSFYNCDLRGDFVLPTGGSVLLAGCRGVRPFGNSSQFTLEFTGTSNTFLEVSDWSGALSLVAINQASAQFAFHCNGAEVELQSGCVAGTITVVGNADLINNANGATVIDKTAARDDTIYVDTLNGTNAGSGLASDPVRTLAQALVLVRAAGTRRIKLGIGTYTASGDLVGVEIEGMGEATGLTTSGTDLQCGDSSFKNLRWYQLASTWVNSYVTCENVRFRENSSWTIGGKLINCILESDIHVYNRLDVTSCGSAGANAVNFFADGGQLFISHWSGDIRFQSPSQYGLIRAHFDGNAKVVLEDDDSDIYISGFADVENNLASGQWLRDSTVGNLGLMDGIHVTNNGNDSNTGSLGSPLLTIAQALVVAGQRGTRKIRLAEGTYSHGTDLEDVEIEGAGMGLTIISLGNGCDSLDGSTFRDLELDTPGLETIGSQVHCERCYLDGGSSWYWYLGGSLIDCVIDGNLHLRGSLSMKGCSSGIDPLFLYADGGALNCTDWGGGNRTRFGAYGLSVKTSTAGVLRIHALGGEIELDEASPNESDIYLTGFADIIATQPNPYLVSNMIEPDYLKRLLGMSGENNYIDNPTFDTDDNLLTARVRLFPTAVLAAAATDGGTGEGETSTYNITGTHDTAEQWKTLRQVRT